MKTLTDVNPGTRIKAADLQQCIDAIRELQNMNPGPGLGKSADGKLFALAASIEAKPNQSELTGDAVDLDHVQGTQDTDEWAAATDKKPVTVHVLTDWGYDTDTHELYFRTRPVKLVAGSIGPETTRVICETAIEDVD